MSEENKKGGCCKSFKGACECTDCGCKTDKAPPRRSCGNEEPPKRTCGNDSCKPK